MDYSLLDFDFLPSSGIIICIPLFLWADVQLLLLRQCHSQDDWLPTPYVIYSVYVLRQSGHICNSSLWWTGWQWGTFLAVFFGFSGLFFHQSETISSLIRCFYIWPIYDCSINWRRLRHTHIQNKEKDDKRYAYFGFQTHNWRTSCTEKLVISSSKATGDNQSAVILLILRALIFYTELTLASL